MTVLTQATREWSSRTADERFSSIEDLHRTACSYRDLAATATATGRSLSVQSTVEGDIVLSGGEDNVAKLSNWSFKQLADAADAPEKFISRLPARLAAECLNEGFQQISASDKHQLLFAQQDDGLKLRAVNSPKYSRIWNADITERLLDLEGEGVWQPAPAAFDGSRGLYLGDRDMFAFMVDNNRRIFEKGPEGGLSRGFFVWNSEVGARSFGIMTFLYEYVCGNHRVWGASGVNELRLSHVGTNDKLAIDELEMQLIAYSEASAEDDELKIERMRTFQIGENREKALEAIFGIKNLAIGKKTIANALDLAERREDWYGNPLSAWGVGGALTEIARDLPNADERVALERASTKVMDLALI